ncbi:MAG: four helix bundle protein [Bacteroidota bacterium]
MTFNHEQLKVYQNALHFTANTESWVAVWDKKHAICDHLPRAAGSIVENVAMASAAYSAMKVRGLDYALGSTLECAACLDIAGIKGLLDSQRVIHHKKDLLQLFRMLVGLRHAWSPGMVKEGRVQYGSGRECLAGEKETVKGRDKAYRDETGGFHHERLDLYRVALEVVVLFSSRKVSGALSNSVFRRLDVLLTSMVLNTAEGNGRFSSKDQRRFLGVSHESAIKMAANLDLCVIQKALPADEADKCKRLLSRVAAMTVSMIGNEEI